MEGLLQGYIAWPLISQNANSNNLINIYSFRCRIIELFVLAQKQSFFFQKILHEAVWY